MSGRGLYIIVSLIVSAFCGWAYGALLVGADGVFAGIIGVLGILAGVLVAVISIVGDPSMLMPGNWRVGFEHAQDIQNKIARFSHLFAVYLVTIITVLFVMIIEHAKLEGFGWAYDVLMGLSLFAFLLSMPLPYSLMGIQKERMQLEIGRRTPRKD